VPFGQGLLFRVSRPSAPSNYVFGTIHLGLDVPPDVDAALARSGSFVMEAVLDEASVLNFSQLMFYSDERHLAQDVGPSIFQATAGLLARYGIPMEASARIKPWAAILTLNLPLNGQEEPLDKILMTRATDLRLPVFGLESMEEQAGVLAGLALEDQVAILRDTACHHDVYQRDLAEMIRLYHQRDLAGLLRHTGKYQPDETVTHQRFMEALLWNRNKRMVQRLLPRFVQGKTFVAVGALHLPGEAGVLRLLEQRGYTITRIY
jgi:uncharacterized protein YbaP (TraB family)